MLDFILKLFGFSKPSKDEEKQAVIETPKATVEKPPVRYRDRTYITIEDVITASGKYRSRLSSLELTPDVMDNISKLVTIINSLFKDLDYKPNLKVSSGFRPSSVNASIKGAAKKSNHLIGLAVDLEDVSGDIDKLMMNNDTLLKKYGLWLEHPDSTKSWCHLDLKDRGKRAKNVFRP